MLIALVTPVIAVVVGMIVLDEQMTWRTLAGGALIISGIALIVLRGRTHAMRRLGSPQE